MLRGVDITSDTLRTERLIDWYYEEKMEDFLKTMLLVAAVSHAQDLSGFIDRYRQSIFPTGQNNEDFIKKYQEVLDAEASKVYNVKEIKLK